MPSEKQFFSQLKEVNKKIEQAEDEKTNLIKDFMAPVKEVITLLSDLWQEQEGSIKKELHQLVKDLGFQFKVHHDLSEYSLMSNIKDRFPITNDGNDFIEIYNISYAWELESQSTSEMIIVDVNPIDIRARYPVDPEENLEAFTYKIPTKVHQKFIDDTEDKEEVLIDYFNKTVKEELESIANRIKKYLNITNSKIDSIDLSDPQVREEIARRLKQF